MAEHLLLPKRVARAFPRLGKFAQSLESGFLNALVALLRTLPGPVAFALARGCMRLLGPLTPLAQLGAYVAVLALWIALFKPWTAKRTG